MTSSAQTNDQHSRKPVTSIKGFCLGGGTKVVTTLGKRRRLNAADESDSDNAPDSCREQHQAVSGFGEEGAIPVVTTTTTTKTTGPLVIARLENRDWKSAARIRRHGGQLVTHTTAPSTTAIDIKQDETERDLSDAEKIQWGLSVHPRRPGRDIDTAGQQTTTPSTITCPLTPASSKAIQKSSSLEEEALEALLSHDEVVKRPELIIATELASANSYTISEHDAFKQAVAAAPDVSSLEDYERVPVEEFGAALLRGMGWNGEKVERVRDIKRRQNLLGLGAKELKEAEELGAWVNKSDTKRLNAASARRHDGKPRPPKTGDYWREEEQRRERREERSGGSYRRGGEYEKDYRREAYQDRYRDRKR
ncbi:BgTH12-02888 [Blumeria graminis f. sp. triticale]|uniref:Pre-mRNA-splicing factor n=1 Tax=Blumeria graminis f. sp. triticale TaxID=1689686 RepID=A0A9W4D8F0_BLUGR|nr:BgTH12-02888 [Blumeria graminis f. sp. triticale]